MAIDQLRAGELDTLVALQRKSTSFSPSGDPQETWSTLALADADVNPVLGIERDGSQQLIAREQTEFKIRWSVEIQDLSPLDRIICPSDDASLSPLKVRSIYDIFAVYMIGRNIGLRVLAARQVG